MFVQLARWVPATGIVFAVLVVAASLLTSDTPGTGATDAEIVSYYGDDDNRTAERISLLLIGLAVLCFATFLGSLRGALARAEGEPARITTSAIAGGAVFIALAGAAHVVGTAVAEAGEAFDDFTVDPDTARVLLSTSRGFFVLSLFAAAVMTFSAATVALWMGGLPRWLGWFGVVATVAAVLGFLGWPSLVVLAWIVATSAYLVWPQRQRAAAEAAGA
jgi:hypothetical protein